MGKLGYTLGKVIGEGTYSKVCSATIFSDDAEEKVACKIIHKRYAGGDFIKKFLPRELQFSCTNHSKKTINNNNVFFRIIRTINHPNIVTIYDILELSDIIYIFMDYCRNGDLLEYIRNNGPLTEDRSRNYFGLLSHATTLAIPQLLIVFPTNYAGRLLER